MPFISTNLDIAIRRYVNLPKRSQDTNCATFRWIGQSNTISFVDRYLLIMLIRKNSFFAQFSNCSCHNVSFSHLLFLFYQIYKISSKLILHMLISEVSIQCAIEEFDTNNVKSRANPLLIQFDSSKSIKPINVVVSFVRNTFNEKWHNWCLYLSWDNSNISE